MENRRNFIKDIIEFLNGVKTMVSDLSTKGRRTKQIPNLLSLSRIGCSLIIPPLAMSGNLIPAAIVTILALLTDAVDGKIARKLDAVSEFGKNLDPVCDKILAGSLLLPLIGNGSPFLSLGLCINLILELGIAGVNLKSKAKGNVPRTTMLGKIKTVALSLLIASLYVSISYKVVNSIIPTMYILATVTQAITLADYQRIDKKKDAKKKALKRMSEANPTVNHNNADFSKIMNKGAVDYFISKTKEEKQRKSLEPTVIRLTHEQITYSSDDYKKLREEVIRTKKISNEQAQTEIKDDFQKIK